MKGLKELLLKEQFRLETIIKDTKNRLEKAPKEDYAYLKVIITSNTIGA